MKIIIAITLLLVGLGVLARGVELINGNYIFGFDHGREYLMTRDIVDFKDLRLIGTPLGGGSAGFQGIFHGPLYYYLLAIVYILYGGDPYGGVVLMFVFGVSSLGIAFLLGRRLFGKTGGLILVVLLALSPTLIAQSRFIWSPYPSTFFILMSFYCIQRMNESKKWVFFSAFFSALIYHFEFAIAVPMILTLILYSILILKIKKIQHYLLLLLGFVAATIPMLLFEVRHNFMAIRGFASYIFDPSKKGSDVSFLEFQIDHFNSFVYNFRDSIPYAFQPTLITFIVFIAALFLSYKLVKKGNVQNFIHYIVILIFTTFACLTLLRNTVYQYYLYHLLIGYNILFVFIFMSIKFRLRSFASIILALIIIISVFLSIPKLISMVTYDLNDYGGYHKIKGKMDALDYIYKDAGNEKFGLLVFTPPVYTYPYDYLTYLRGKKDGAYIPPKEKKQITYLLIEVDSDKPWSYKGWLETVIKDGKVLKEVVLPSGIIIQKRQF